MDKNRIEELAVIEVRSLFLNNSSKLSPNISEGDKGISFDGNVILFSDDEMTKKNYLSSLPVQVKGREVVSFSEESAKFYKFDLETFENFQLEDGTIVFLVEILKGQPIKRKVFYKFLDVRTLNEVIERLIAENANTSVIELEELNENNDLYEIFFDIAIRRKTYNYSDVKYDSFLDGKESRSIFEKDVVDSKIKALSDYEYRDINSNFNQQLIKEMEKVLTKAIYYNSEEFLKLLVKIQKIEKINLLPKKTSDLVTIIKAKYEFSLGELDKGKHLLKQINCDNYMNELARVYLDMYSFDSKKIDLDEVIKKYIEEEELKKLYESYYFLKNQNLSDFYKIFKSKSVESLDWDFLHAQYLMYVYQYLDAEKIFNNINEKTNDFQVKYYELISKYNYLQTQNSQSNFQKFNELLEEVNVLKKRVSKIESLSMPVLERLHFELELLIEPDKGINEISTQLTKADSNDNKNYLIENKIRLLLRQEKYKEVLEYIGTLEYTQISNQVIGYKFISLYNLNQFELFSLYIDEVLIDDVDIDIDLKTKEVILELYLEQVKLFDDFDEKIFENTIKKIVDIPSVSLINVLHLEEVRFLIGSKKFKNDLDTIIEKIEFVTDIELKRIEYFLENVKEVTITEKIYSVLSLQNQIAADEVCILSYLQLSEFEKCREIFSKYDNDDLTKKLLYYKITFMLQLGQYHVVVNMYKYIDKKNEDFLNKILIAKIEEKDDYEIKNITGTLFSSSNIEYQLNAAVALIEFGLDIKKGIQFFEKEILFNGFNNDDLNRQMLALFLSNNKKIESDSEIDVLDNSFLRWSKFQVENNEVEYIFVSGEWKVKQFDPNIHFEYFDSDFSIMCEGVNVGETVEYEKREYKLIEELSLSTFIFRRIIKMQSGGLDSEKPLKMINISNNGFDELEEFLKRYDRSEMLEELDKVYKVTHGVVLYDRLKTKEDLIFHYFNLMTDKSFQYFSGKEIEYSQNKKYQMSIVSLTYLSSLDLLDILDSYENIYLDYSSKNNLRHTMDKSLINRNANDKYDKDKKSNLMISTLKKMNVHSRKLIENDCGIIDSRIVELEILDDTSMQTAIDKESVLFYEDEGMQLIIDEMFEVSSGSIGSLISDYYLNIIKDPDGYLDILFRVLEEKRPWVVSEASVGKLYLQLRTEEKNTVEKFIKWNKLYHDFFKLIY